MLDLHGEESDLDDLEPELTINENKSKHNHNRITTGPKETEYYHER